MPAYMIAEMDVKDPVAYERYKAASAEVLARYGGRYVARGGRTAALEGPAPNRIVIIEFANIEAAQRWYNSKDYEAVRAHRANSADARLYAVETS